MILSNYTLKNGAQVLAHHSRWNLQDDGHAIVLCSFRGSYVTWCVDDKGNAYWGHYWTTLVKAEHDYNNRVARGY